MNQKLSKRLSDIYKSLSIKPGMHILEIGCGSGALARVIAQDLTTGKILAIDRSEKAIRQAIKNSQEEIASGRLSFRNRTFHGFYYGY